MIDHTVLIPLIRKAIPSMVAQQIVGVQPMTGTGGQSLYAKYFGEKEYNKKYWPYQVTIPDSSKRYEAERWCWERFKGRYWNSHGRVYVFKRKEDYEWFLLRWS